MKHARSSLLALLFAAACGAPAAPGPTPKAAASPEPAAGAPAIELVGKEREASVVGRTKEGGKAYEVKLGPVDAALAAPDGGAFVVVEEKTIYSPGKALQVRTLRRLDAQGREAWQTTIEGGGWAWHLFLAGGKLFAFDLVSPAYTSPRHLHVLEAETGKRLADVDIDAATSDVAHHGAVVVMVADDRIVRLSEQGEPVWTVRARLFPTADPSALTHDRRVAVGSDGTVLTGAADGSLLALDEGGQPRWQLGVRGAVTRVEARGDGDFVVRTADGATVVSSGGVVRREIAPAAEPTPVGGVVDRREGKAQSADAGKAAPWRPTLAWRARPEGPPGKPFAAVASVVANAPDDVWVLGRPAAPGADDSDNALFHFDGRAWTDHGRPRVKLAKEVFARGQPAAEGSFSPLRLARSPSGALLVIGTRTASGGTTRVAVLERAGGALRERRDFFPALVDMETEWSTSPSYAASAGGREVLCSSEPPRCVSIAPGKAPEKLSIDEARAQEGPDALVYMPRAKPALPILFAGETLWKVNGAALGERQVWGLGPDVVSRWDGAAFHDHDHPVVRPRSAWAGGADDLWVAGEGGVARFDGARWWRVLGAYGAVTGSRRGDVWVYGAGLWRVTAEPQAAPEIEGTAVPPPPPAAPSAPLAVDEVDPAVRLAPVVIDVPGGRPLRAAIGVARGPRGVIWLHEGARVVEVDGARARVLYQAPAPERFVCWYAPEPDCNLCAECTERRPRVLGAQHALAPTGPGAGGLLVEEGWMSARGGAVVAGPRELSEVLAVAASPAGSVWAVSAERGDVPRVVVERAGGARLLAGVPQAAYAAVAVRADDDAWLAGSLTTVEGAWPARLAGEGTLVRFDGRAFRRHRAPDGALLATAAAAPGEAWAVGLGGGVLHVKGDVATPLYLARGGARVGAVLRDVAASGGEVWIAGDDGTLVHGSGAAFRRVDTSAAGSRAAFAAVVPPADGQPGWVVGPSGIWRVTR